GETFTPTATLLDLLTTAHPETWGEESTFGRALTAQRLGRMLAGNYGIHSTRLDRTGPRGYTRASLERAWRRMGVSTSAPDVSTPSQETGASGATGETGAPPQPPAAADCTVCGFPLHAAITADGFTTHPACEEAS